MPTTGGAAFEVDVAEVARTLSMQETYARALYAYIRANPSVWNSQEFVANLLIFLMNEMPGFNCQEAFTNEFARRDYFTQQLPRAPELRQIIEGVRIPARFDVAYVIDTGEYDFATGNLPFGRKTLVLNDALTNRWINSPNNSESCARQILEGTGVQTNMFPWRFEIVNEAGENSPAGFPFPNSIQLSSDDARILFERFGRQLFALVNYRVQAANNGERLVQIVATDGQLFGLSSDAVVRVSTYAHPTLSQPSYLEVEHPLSVTVDGVPSQMTVTLAQEGFRAVGIGERTQQGTGLTAGGVAPVRGSAAVGQSSFVLRVATTNPGLSQLQSYCYPLRDLPANAEVEFTLFGNVEFADATATRAPVSGRVIIKPATADLASGCSSRTVAFSGAFQPRSPAPQPPEPERLDTSPVAPASDQTSDNAAPADE